MAEKQERKPGRMARWREKRRLKRESRARTRGEKLDDALSRNRDLQDRHSGAGFGGGWGGGPGGG